MSMGDSLRIADITRKLMQHLLDELQKFYIPRPWPIIGLYKISSIYGLVDEILEAENISEELLKKIGKVLGRRWIGHIGEDRW